jgi:hypothetical protein
MSPYESMYWSWWNHPLACWIGAALLLPLVLRRLSFLHAYMVLCLALTCGDAMITGMWSKLGGEASAIYTPLTFFCILQGDWRVYWLLRREESGAQVGGWGGWPAIRVALSMAVVPSLIVEIAGYAFPAAMSQGRVMFLLYELSALGIMTALQGIYLAQWLSGRPAAHIKWARGVLAFAQVQYVLWALADMIILSGYDVGFALRIVPNVMYYALYLPVVWALAPEEEARG